MKLTAHDIVLIRCGLLRRMDNLKGLPQCQESYDRSKELLDMLFPLARDGKGCELTAEQPGLPEVFNRPDAKRALRNSGAS